MYYKNNDYTARTKICDGETKYYIRFHGVVDSPVVEVDVETFSLYIKEFNRPQERDRNEKRRHLTDCEDIDSLAAPDPELDKLTWCDVEEVLKTCTELQRKHYTRFISGYSFSEIARLEGCSRQNVTRSVKAVIEKVKKYFLD